MPRIIGIDIPNNKQVYFALTYIQGIGKHFSAQILEKAEVEPTTKAGDLTEDQVSRIAQIITNEYVVDGQYRRQISQSINRLKEIACYRGLRHRRGLPVRGQNTQSNARTRKGRKKTVAGKKSVKALR
jgi:small subunit ribosomal protein S13